jgi:hypothetical protein
MAIVFTGLQKSFVNNIKGLEQLFAIGLKTANKTNEVANFC